MRREALGDSFVCHCRMCQKVSSCPGLTLIGIQTDTVHDAFHYTHGKPVSFSSSNHCRRFFCGSCGIIQPPPKKDFNFFEVFGLYVTHTRNSLHRFPDFESSFTHVVALASTPTGPLDSTSTRPTLKINIRISKGKFIPICFHKNPRYAHHHPGH